MVAQLLKGSKTRPLRIHMKFVFVGEVHCLLPILFPHLSKIFSEIDQLMGGYHIQIDICIYVYAYTYMYT